MPNNAFSILSFFYSSFLLIIYFYKKRINNLENKIYKYLVLSNILTVVSVLICWFTIMNREKIALINNVFSKMALIGYTIWVLVFTLYVFFISSKNKDDIFLKKYNLFKKIISMLLLLLSIMIVILPLNYYSEKNIAYSFGPSANVVYITTAICMLYWIIICIINFKNLKSKKYLPIITFITLLIIAIIIQKINPAILLTTAVVSFVTTLMYFTIENPDVKMLQKMELAKDSAEKANRAKSDFLSSMSHEIRTPLNAIVGFSEDIKEYEDQIPKEVKEDVSYILDASNTLLEIVGNILDINKIEASKLDIEIESYDFKKEIDGLTKVYSTRIGDKPIDFICNISNDIPDKLIGDKLHVKEIISNLLSNAIKYTDKGEIELNIKCFNKNDICNLLIIVRDTGKGIKKEDLDKLFTKFERLDVERNTTFNGTGLGLAITKNLVDMMGGKINVQSYFGKGSLFMVTLPQKIDNSNLENTQKIDLGLMQSKIMKNKKILIVDDNKLNLKVAHRALDGLDFIIEEVLSGEECINKIAKGNKYDLILMDIMMPKLSGTSTLKKLQEDPTFKTPVIALTADAIAGARERYLNDGFVDYIAKPFTKEQIKEKLNSIFSEKLTINNDRFKDAPMVIIGWDDKEVDKF